MRCATGSLCNIILAILTCLSLPAPLSAQGPDGIGVYYVAEHGLTGRSPSFSTIQAAVDAVDDAGDEILIGVGSYMNVTTVGGHAQVANIATSLTLRGGFTTNTWTMVDPAVDRTVIVGLPSGRGVYASAPATVLVENVMFASCNATGQGASGSQHGGAIYVDGADVTIRGCELVSNIAPNDGAGVYVASGNVTLEGNRIIGNISSGNGGGVASVGGTLALRRNLFGGNTAQSAGGIYANKTLTAMTGNIVADNTVTAGAGGIEWHLMPPPAINVMEHNTFALNQGIAVETKVTGAFPSASATLRNTIIVGHTTGLKAGADSTVSMYGTLWGSGAKWANTNNTDDSGGLGAIINAVDVYQEPGFVDDVSGDYHIRIDSAAFDAGAMAPVIMDYDNEPNTYGHAPDLGADEINIKRALLDVLLGHFTPPPSEYSVLDIDNSSVLSIVDYIQWP